MRVGAIEIFDDYAVAEGGSVAYEVRAVDRALDESLPSRVVVTPGDATAPPSPGAPILSAGDKVVSLRWRYPPALGRADFYGYRVYSRVEGEAAYVVLDGGPILAEGYTDGRPADGGADELGFSAPRPSPRSSAASRGRGRGRGGPCGRPRGRRGRST